MVVSDSAPRAKLLPTLSDERIKSLDVLRGFALLGILLMNIQSFSMIGAAYFNPSAFGSLEGANFWVWFVSHVFADLKFMGIFSMLFGAGICLMCERAQQSGRDFSGLHYRRMFWLMLFGLLHAHLLWFGDILFPYAVCGMIIYPCRNLRPRTLIVLGLAVLLVGSSLSLLAGLSMPYWTPEQLEEFTHESWNPPPERIQSELETYRGGWLDQMESRTNSAVGMQTFVMFYFFLWRAGGLMLIGMALFKYGVFSAGRSARFYLMLVVLGIFGGLPPIFYGCLRNIQAGWPPSAFFVGSQLNYWASVLVSLGWVGAILLFYRNQWFAGLSRRLAAVGRMALSNYLLQTIICTTIFYGHGLGLFGQVSRGQQLLVVLVVWMISLLSSPWWLKRFRYGPLEWLWRSLTYWSPLRMRG